MASSSFLNEEEALKLVDQAIVEARDQYRIQPIDEENSKETCAYWDKVFSNLLKLKKFSQFEWQKKLVTYIADLLIHDRRKNIIVILGTGHGKSLIIQLLADILVQYN